MYLNPYRFSMTETNHAVRDCYGISLYIKGSYLFGIIHSFKADKGYEKDYKVYRHPACSLCFPSNRSSKCLMSDTIPMDMV